MALRTPHGKAKKAGHPGPRVEVLPADEQPAAVPAPPRPEKTEGRGAGGQFAPGNPWAAMGGKARSHKAQFEALLSSTIGIGEEPPEDLRGFVDAGIEFIKVNLDWLASIAGGEVGPGPSSMVQTAGLELVLSRYWAREWLRTRDPGCSDRASKHGAASQQRIMAAREIAVKDAQGRRGRNAKGPNRFLAGGGT